MKRFFKIKERLTESKKVRKIVMAYSLPLEVNSGDVEDHTLEPEDHKEAL